MNKPMPSATKINQILSGFRKKAAAVVDPPERPDPPTSRGERSPAGSDPAATRPGWSDTGMRIKSYYSFSVDAAMSAARRELGPDAVLICTRRSSPECRQLGEHEVVFGVIPRTPAASSTEGDGPPRMNPKGSPAGVAVPNSAQGNVQGELRELRQQMVSLQRLFGRSAFWAIRSAPFPESLSSIYLRLAESDLDESLAMEIVEAVQRGLPDHERPNDDQVEKALTQELSSRFMVSDRLGVDGRSPAIVVLVGPPGAGKTTSLVKLAMRYGLGMKRSTQILTMDNYRIGATDQLATFASLLGVGFTSLETTQALARAFEEHRAKDLILVDTPGISPGNLDHGRDLAAFLSRCTDANVHLVLPANLGAVSLARAVERLEIFAPARLLFTMLDETESFGPLFREACRTKKAVSFLSTGQEIPENFVAASKENIVRLLLRGKDSVVGLGGE